MEGRSLHGEQLYGWEEKYPILRASRLHLLFHHLWLQSGPILGNSRLVKTMVLEASLLIAVGVVGILDVRMPAGGVWSPISSFLVYLWTLWWLSQWYRFLLRRFALQFILETTEVWLNAGSPSSQLWPRVTDWVSWGWGGGSTTTQPVRDLRVVGIGIVNSKLYVLI